MVKSYHQRTVAALENFVNQRPHLEPGNYISSGWDDEGRKAYRSESRRITRDLHDARSLLQAVVGRDFTPAEWAEAFTAYGRRLSWDGTTLNYCVGQYWPTEYRVAVCAVLANLLRCDYRSTNGRDKWIGRYSIQRHFRRVFGRGLANRWF